MKRNSYQKYTTEQIHELLCQKLLSKEYRDGVFTEDVYKQACFCPNFIPLKGMELGLDWGIIINPSSPKFGQVVFEHDGCGCANHDKQFGNQRGTSWLLRKRKRPGRSKKSTIAKKHRQANIPR